MYKLACKHNFLILEDDPYWFINFGEENIESYLSMDIEQRVLRFDSFSKIMSSGNNFTYLVFIYSRYEIRFCYWRISVY